MHARVTWCLPALAFFAVPAWGQGGEARTVAVPPGSVSGEVVDRDSGELLPFVLVTLERPRLTLFSNERGRFTLPGLGAGRYRLSLRQLGYEPVEVTLLVDAQATGRLRVELVRRPFRLPTVIAKSCVTVEELEPEARAVLNAATENARQMELLAKEFPFLARYHRTQEVLGSDGNAIARTRTATEQRIWEAPSYRPGRAIQEGRGGSLDISFFAATAVLSDEFQETHCFRLSGVDSLDAAGGPRVLLEFEPLRSLTGPDWAGVLAIDTTGLLRRSTARLVAQKPKAHWPTDTSCQVEYGVVGGAFPIEERLVCWITGRRDRFDVAEGWVLECQRFTRRIPGVPRGGVPDSGSVWARRLCPSEGRQDLREEARGPAVPGAAQVTGASRGFSRYSRPTLAQGLPSLRTTSAVKSKRPWKSEEPTP